MPASYTKFYLYPWDGLPSAAGLTWRGSWATTPVASTATIALDPLKDRGSNAARTASEAVLTNPYRVAVLRGVSRPLAAQTISGTLDVLLGIQESNADADFYWKVYVYVTVGDTDAVRGVLLDYEDSGTEWPTTSTGTALPSAQSLTSQAVTEGDRLVIEIGFISRNAHSTSRTGTIRVGCMSTNEGFTALSDLTVGSTSTTTLAPFVTFSNAITLADVKLSGTDGSLITNDTFATAYAVTGAVTFTGDMRRATRDGDEPTPCPGSGGDTHARYNSLWWKWVCPVTQSATLTAIISNGASTFNTCLQVLTGSPGSFSTVACQGETGPTTETITFAATGGVTYYFLVTSIYFGGGASLSFAFDPAVEPVQVERIIPLEIDTWPDADTVTAMGWVKLQNPGSPSGIQHFFYMGNDVSPFTGGPYFWVGTDVDGQTLRLDVLGSGSPALQTFLGPVLTWDTFYHWALVKNGDVFSVYLSTEGGSPLDVLLAIGPETVPMSFVPERAFLYGSPTAIPKAFKLWAAVLTPTKIRIERETYAAVDRDDPTPTPTVPYVWNVTPLRQAASAGLAGGGLPDYSGWDHRFGAALFGDDVEWPYIVGPNINALARRPFVDSFDNYIDGYVDGSYFPGVVDPAAFWDFLTQPSDNAYISDGTGLAGSKAFDESTAAGGAADVLFEHDGYTGRCGHVSFYSFKRTAAPNDALGNQRGAGMQILGAHTTLPDTGLFGFENPLSASLSGDLHFFNNYDGFEETVEDVYRPNVFQWFDVYFQLSTVAAGSPLDVNPDGVIRIFVDDVLVYTKTGLQLTVDNSRWPDLINTWDITSFHWGGVLDGVRIGTDCREPPAQSTGFLSWVEARWYQP